MGKICFACEHENQPDHVFCSICGAPLALASYINREVTTRITETTRDSAVVETESAIRVFERAWGWAKLVGAVAGAIVALLVGAGIWQFVDLHSTAKTAEAAVEKAKTSAEQSISDTATTTRANIGEESAKSLQSIRSAARNASESSVNAQTIAKQAGSAITTQATNVRQEFQNQAATVNRDVASAKQQIQAASQLQPQMEVLQKQLASAQFQIQEQQAIITSSEDFAKKIFSSHKSLRFDLKTLDKSQYATIAYGKDASGVDVEFFFLLLPNSPVSETLQVQFNQTVPASGSFFNVHNLLGCFIQKQSEGELLGKPVSVSYFPDTSDKNLMHTLTTKDGQLFSDGVLIPLAGPVHLPTPTQPNPKSPL